MFFNLRFSYLRYFFIGFILSSTIHLYVHNGIYRNLHTMIRKDRELSETFAFLDPGVTFKLNDDFQRYFVNRLMDGNVGRVFFLPHNEGYVFHNCFNVINFKIL